jgi:hypothetical protein
MEQLLEKLFECGPKIRIIRFFVRNPEKFFEFSVVLGVGQTNSKQARSELKKLLKIGLIKQKFITIHEEVKPKRSKRRPARVFVKTRRAIVYFVNNGFPLIGELRELVIRSAAASKFKIASQLQRIGRVKLAVISGIFLNEESARTDLLIVGDNIKQGKLARFLAQIESELGKPIQYALMNADEFKYRMHMYDRFLKDILENGHEKLINKIGV